MTNPPLQVLGYARVSTAEQARDGVSLQAQADKVRQFCRLHDLNLVELIEDPGASAKSLDRPGLKRALGALDRSEAAGLVVAKLDRLTRSVVDLGTLIQRYFGHEKASAQLFSVADSIDTRSAAGRMVLNVVMSMAQWERETIVERTQDAMNHKRAHGERLGTVPYGYALDADDARRSKDGHPVALVPSAEERDAIAVMHAFRDMGCSYRRIALELDDRGYRPRRGKTWSKSTIAEILGRDERL